MRNRIGAALLAGALLFLAGAVILAWRESAAPSAASDPARVARGKAIYDAHCASCHGANLEGRQGWRQKLPNGRMPAPPHDASGHTWHHPDAVLFGITKHGLVPGKYATPGYRSDMPAFGGVLSDEDIRDVLAYIKSTWPDGIRRAQAEIDRESRR